MSHDGDTIIFGAGVCEDAVIGDEQFHQRVIDLITLRRFGLLQHVMRDASPVTDEIGEIHRLAGLVVGDL